jgi:hypothetical protein
LLLLYKTFEMVFRYYKKTESEFYVL